MLNPIYTANMNAQQQAWFYAEYQKVSKDELIGVLLALFLGGLGIHKFYMGQTGAGILYLIFSWTGIPSIIGFIECFLMPGRVRDYNAAQAQIIIAGLTLTEQQLRPTSNRDVFDRDASARICAACGTTAQMGAVFCPRCGSGTLAAS